MYVNERKTHFFLVKKVGPGVELDGIGGWGDIGLEWMGLRGRRRVKLEGVSGSVGRCG